MMKDFDNKLGGMVDVLKQELETSEKTALENIALMEDTEERNMFLQALKDAKTGTLNPSAFMEQIRNLKKDK